MFGRGKRPFYDPNVDQGLEVRCTDRNRVRNNVASSSCLAMLFVLIQISVWTRTFET
jgi:hypothetical protein